MKWFRKKVHVCQECGVHFSEVPPSESEWGNLCPTHRAPVMEEDLKRKAVLRWANDNWRRLHDMMVDERAKDSERYAAQIRNLENCQANQNFRDQMSKTGLSGWR